jgi:tetratricopeptide (TPR) repeat protein
MDKTKQKKLIPILSFLLALSIIGIYWQVRNFDFINYDDPVYVTENPRVLEGLNWESIKWAFTGIYGSNWFPLTWLSLMLDRQLFGVNPGAFHLINVMFHTVNAIVLFIILSRCTKSIWPSFFTAVVFGLHPLRVESVAWIAERKDVLSTLFWMFTMLGYIRYVEKPIVRRYMIVLAAFIAGLMSKPMLVTLPFVLLLVDYWPLQRIRLSRNIQQENPDQRNNTRTISFLVLEKVPLFVLSAASCVMTLIAQKSKGTVSSLEVFSLSDRLTNALVSYTSYIGKMFWPTGLAIFYPHPQGNIPLLKIIVSTMILFAVSLAVIFSCRKKRYLLVGWLWYLGTLVPVIGLVQVGAQAMADRYTYIPLIGLSIMIAWSVRDIVSKWRYKNVIVATGGALICAILMVCTYRQLSYWRNNETLFTRTLNVTSDNYVAHNNIGIALAGDGDLEQAMEHFKKTLKIKPWDTDALFNLAGALVKLGKPDEAMVYYNRVLELEPDDADTYNALALAQVQQGNYKQAISIYYKALQKNPESALLHSGLGSALLEAGQLNPAVTELQTAVRLKPTSQTYCNLGVAVSSKGELTKAIEYYKKAIRLDAKNAKPYYNLGNSMLAQGSLVEAIAQYKKAINIDPNYVKAHSNLAIALAQQGKLDEAVEHFSKAINVDPNYVKARSNLAIALAQQGKFDEAMEHLSEAVRLQPQDADALCIVGDILVQQGQSQEAIKQYREVLKINPEHPGAKRGLENALSNQPKSNTKSK